MLFKPTPKQNKINFCGVELLVREWSLRQRLEIESFAAMEVATIKDRFRELLLECIFDSDNNPITQNDLNDLPYSEVEELLKHALTINQISNDKVGELAKN